MIVLQDKTRTHTVASIDIEELQVNLDLQEFGLILLNLTNRSAQFQCIKDFKILLDFNQNFDIDLLEQHLDLLINRYFLLKDEKDAELSSLSL